MAFSREELFTLLPQLVATSAKSFGHAARVKIILHLAEHGTTSFHDLLQILPLDRSTVSQHLRLLRRSNMVVVHEKVPHTYYGLNFEELRRYMLVAETFLGQFRTYGIDPKDMLIVEEFEGMDCEAEDLDESGEGVMSGRHGDQ